jgi:hypothetical protein
MFRVIIFILLFIPQWAVAQTLSEKDYKKHLEQIDKSREKQSVICSEDTIYKSGTPYGILKRVSPGSLVMRDYSLKTLYGKEVVYLQENTYPNPASSNGVGAYWAFLFIESGARGEAIQKLGQSLAELIESCGLMENGELSEAGEKKFLMLYPIQYSTKGAQIAGGGNNFQTVERNRGAMIMVFGSQIKQDQKAIGTFQKNQGWSNGHSTYTISFYLPNGVKAAEAVGDGISPDTWRVVTMKDNRVSNVAASFYGAEKDLAAYLSQNYYL